MNIEKPDYQTLKALIFFLEKRNLIDNMKDLAKKIDTNYTYLSGVRKGHKPFSDDLRSKIFDKFGLKIEAKPYDLNEHVVSLVKEATGELKEKIEDLENELSTLRAKLKDI